MREISTPQICYIACMSVGFGLLSLRWVFFDVETTGFFVMLGMLVLAMVRWRFPRWRWSAVADGMLCVLLYPGALAVAMFTGMYYRLYILAVLPLVFFDVYASFIALLAGLAGVFLGHWQREWERRHHWRDIEAERYYNLESLQNDLLAASSKIEKMTAVSERARIAREIHDNAGHEIVAAYMSFQTVRASMERIDAKDSSDFFKLDNESLALFDAALERLDSGTQKIREAVHNLAPVTALGVEALEETCKRIPAIPVTFTVFGDTTHVPVYIWNALDSCLNEALTNATRHAQPKYITVSLDATPRLVRLCVENDGILYGIHDEAKRRVRTSVMGTGLRNLRYRMAAIGGSLAVDAGEVYRLICVVPVSGKE